MSETAQPAAFTVSQLTASLKRLVESSPLHAVTVKGEISGWRVYGSGHAYFTLKDAGAQLQCVMFAGSLSRCAARDSLREGMQGLFSGEIEIYAPHGRYQLIVRRAVPAGRGDLAAEFEKLKARLAAEGLFDESKKKPLPFLPRRIGIVTSPSGAVIHDMANVLFRRFPNMEVLLYPARVQGEGAAQEIARGVEWFNSPEREWRADVLIVGRGGGSMEELWAFNEEAAVRAVAASRIPVISAVGHETDFTLCDFAADRRAGTPSIAAETCVPVQSELAAKISALSGRMARSLRHAAETRVQRIDSATFRMANALRIRRDAAAAALARAAGRMAAALRAPAAALDERISGARGRLASALRASARAAEARLAKAESSLRLLGPESSFKRGWSVTTFEGGGLVRSADVPQGAAIITRVAGGEFRSVVKKAARRPRTPRPPQAPCA